MSSYPQPPAPFGAVAAIAAESRRVDDSETDYNITPAEKAESTDTTGPNSEDGLGTQAEEKITALARRLSHISRQSSVYPDEGTNTFLDPASDPTLDPNSDQFILRKWVKNMLSITSRDPDRYPRRTAGVSFRNLSAFGYGTAADYQMDVANMWLKGLGWLRGVLGYGKKLRIDILRDFEGYISTYPQNFVSC